MLRDLCREHARLTLTYTVVVMVVWLAVCLTVLMVSVVASLIRAAIMTAICGSSGFRTRRGSARADQRHHEHHECRDAASESLQPAPHQKIISCAANVGQCDMTDQAPINSAFSLHPLTHASTDVQR